MDATTAEYEFLDLTDINEEERSSLTSALFASAPTQPSAPLPEWSSGEKAEAPTAWTEPNYALNDAVNMTTLYVVHPHAVDLSSCSSGTPGPPTASSSLDSLPAAEREMAPHSPQRNVPNNSNAPPSVPPPTQLAYSQPPPAVYNVNPATPWPQHIIPPSVYVSQVTANVNVHGYMGQYYHSQYVPHHHPPPQESRGRDSRDRNKGRRGGGVKRVQSPPPTPYVYHQYYQSPLSAQGAPLYHQGPMYYPGYFGYSYVPYVDFGIMEDPNNPGDKGPDEYPPEMILESEMPHELFYSPHPCLPAGPIYDHNRPMEGPCPIESYQYYVAPTPQNHQLNVHAKNYVRQGEHKNYNVPPQPEVKAQENRTKNNSPINNVPVVDSIPIKDLKISPSKTAAYKQTTEKPAITNQTAPKVPANETAVPKPVVDNPKPAWTPNKSGDSNQLGANKTPSIPVVSQTIATSTSPAPTLPSKAMVPTPNTQNKLGKTATPPPFVKSGPSPQLGAVIMPQHGLPSKAPFANKHKKEVPSQPKPQEPNEPQEPATNVATPVTVNSTDVKKGAVPKTPTPVAIPVHNQNTVSITAKAPFSSTRKTSSNSSETQMQPSPSQPQAPTASDFPLPPGPRRVVEQPVNTVAPADVSPPTQTTGKTWASLFGSNSTPAPQTDNAVSSTQTISACTVTTTTSVNVTRPIAKVGPYDASPLSAENHIEKNDINNSSDKTNNTPTSKTVIGKENSMDSKLAPLPMHVNDPNAYRMGEFLSKYQLNHHSVSLQPRGLCNRSNYCYINAILQALIACPPFYNMLRNLPYQLKKEKSNTPIIDAMVELVSEFSPLPPGARVTRPERTSRSSPGAANGENTDSGSTVTSPPVNFGPAFEPLSVLHMLRDMNNGDSFRIEGRQEDAEEFLGCLLNGLNDEMLELIKLVDPDDPKEVPVVNGNNTALESDDDDNWKVMGPKNKGSIERRCLAGRTPLSDIFRGQLRSRLHRATDTTASDTTHCVQPFFTLPLDIERSTSVREALERVTCKDRLEGVTCPSKGRPVEAWQQVLLEQLPAVLLLHLKCFLSRPSDGATVKIMKTIDYPIDLKIDSKIISAKVKYGIKQRSYKLFAVVYHEGSEAEKGHYLTDVYHIGCVGWLRYDDSVVTSVTEHQVLHPRSPRTPYLLLYRRQDTMQPIRHQQPS